MVRWKRHRIDRLYRAGQGRKEDYAGLSAALLRLIRKEPLRQRTVLDVGCASGRLAFALADQAARVIGIDRSNEAIERAQQRAAALGLKHVSFHCLDAEAVNYCDLGSIDLVVANLCMSDEILRRAAAVLPASRFIAFAAFHREQWKETGKVSRFAYEEGQLEAALSEVGFEPIYLGIEQEVLSFATLHDGLSYPDAAGLTQKWKTDGRWQAFLLYLQGGGRELTIKARVIVKARRR